MDDGVDPVLREQRRDAGLVAARVDGNRRLYSARAERLAELRAALDAFWGERLATLQTVAETPVDSRQSTVDSV